jgi:hypothetical protein
MTDNPEITTTPVAEASAWCCRCRQHLPRSAFYVSRSRSTGVSGYCRPCARAWVATRYRNRRALGFCQCGRPPARGYVQCARCVARDRVRRQVRAPWAPGTRGKRPGTRWTRAATAP